MILKQIRIKRHWFSQQKSGTKHISHGFSLCPLAVSSGFQCQQLWDHRDLSPFAGWSIAPPWLIQTHQTKKPLQMLTLGHSMSWSFLKWTVAYLFTIYWSSSCSLLSIFPTPFFWCPRMHPALQDARHRLNLCCIPGPNPGKQPWGDCHVDVAP